MRAIFLLNILYATKNVVSVGTEHKVESVSVGMGAWGWERGVGAWEWEHGDGTVGMGQWRWERITCKGRKGNLFSFILNFFSKFICFIFSSFTEKSKWS